MTTADPFLDAALAYAARGWPVLPLEGKEPIKSLATGGVHSATTDEAAIRGWWERFPSANIGIACGKVSGLIVVDADKRHGGLETLAGYCLAPTLTVETGGGGLHLYYRLPDVPIKGGTRRFGVGVDCITNGLYVAAPPSVHPDTGEPYRWISEAEIAELPAVLVEVATREKVARPSKVKATSSTPRSVDNRERARKWLATVPGAVSGQGGHNATIRVAAALVNRFGLDRSTAEHLLGDWNRTCTPPWSAKELKHKLDDAEAAGTYDGDGAAEWAARDEQERAAWIAEQKRAEQEREKDRTANMTTSRQREPADDDDRGEGEGDVTPEAAPCPTLAAAAYHGPMGALVKAIEPHTEADPAAILLHLITGVGMLAGRGPVVRVPGGEHHARHFVCIVGETSNARKGTAAGHAKEILREVAEGFDALTLSGLSTGEGLIAAVCDPVTEHVVTRKGSPEYVAVEKPGVDDKRLYILEPEFGRILAVCGRDNNTLSHVARTAWDGDVLRVRTRGNPITATGAHICIVGHITIDELRQRLATVDVYNGFANRFSFHIVGTGKVLPFGGAVTLPAAAIEALRRGIEASLGDREFQIEGEARGLWEVAYRDFRSAQVGPLGAVLARRAQMVLRYALTYAVADGADAIRLPHLSAGLALVEHAEASARILFGDSTGDGVADKLRAFLHDAGAVGLSRAELSAALGRHAQKSEIDHALLLLERGGRAHRERRAPAGGKGRPAEVWFTGGVPSPYSPSSLGGLTAGKSEEQAAKEEEEAGERSERSESKSVTALDPTSPSASALGERSEQRERCPITNLAGSAVDAAATTDLDASAAAWLAMAEGA